MLRNREIALLTLYSLAATALAAAAGFLAPGAAGWAALGLGAALGAWYAVFTAWRYRQLRRLAAYLAAVYAGDRVLDIRSNTEGELSLLKNDLYKITVALQCQADQLGRDKTLLAQALGDISHQLKTPLTSALVLADLLGADPLPPDRRREFAQSLTAQLTRMQWLVGTLLKLSRLDAGAVTLAPAPVPLAELLDRALEPLRIPMELQGVACRLDLPENAAVLCDRSWTVEAVQNVVKNCVEQMPRGGTLTLAARTDALGATLTVEDTGGGIDPADLPRLFERFYTARSRRGDAADHAGIGLALARSILTRQGGTLTAANIPGGARFTFWFPRLTV